MQSDSEEEEASDLASAAEPTPAPEPEPSPPPVSDPAAERERQIVTIVHHLLNLDAFLDSVPQDLHVDILNRLQVVKKECLVGRTFDRARRCQRIIERLHISRADGNPPTARSKTAFSRTYSPAAPPLTLRSSSRLSGPPNIRLDVETSERFWDLELVRFNEMRDEATRRLLERQDQEVQKLIRSASRIRKFDVPAANFLRTRCATLENEDQARALRARADRIEEMELEHARFKAQVSMRARMERLRADHRSERMEFERGWDKRLESLSADMSREIEQKSRAATRSETVASETEGRTPNLSQTAPVVRPPIVAASEAV
jgi:hypothetical protein